MSLTVSKLISMGQTSVNLKTERSAYFQQGFLNCTFYVQNCVLCVFKSTPFAIIFIPNKLLTYD